MYNVIKTKILEYKRLKPSYINKTENNKLTN